MILRNKIVLLTLIIALLSCEVTFNEDLREYVNNISARTPLGFTISYSEIIDGYNAINMGFCLTSVDRVVTVRNRENVDIKLTGFSGTEGNFVTAPFEAFTLRRGNTFDLNITFVPSGSNFNKRVSDKILLRDVDGREYSFYLWATSRRQPLTIYSNGYTEIEAFDVGAFTDNRVSSFIIKNEGLEELNVTNIEMPNGITLNSETFFPLSINEERVVSLYYSNSAVVVDGVDMIIYTDFNLDGEFNLPLYGGGSLKVDVLDVDDIQISKDIDFGTYSSGSPTVLTLGLLNNSLNEMEVEVTVESTEFITDLGDFTFDVDEIKNFYVSFLPTGLIGDRSSKIILRDIRTGRKKTLNLYGYYSP